MAGRRSRKRPWGEPHRELAADSLGGMRRSEAGPGGHTYQVQSVGSAKKEYRCPGCLQEIALGSPHVVAWKEDSLLGWDSGVETRRHWHQECWKRKLRPN